jgi:signal transduction histidine kinase
VRFSSAASDEWRWGAETLALALRQATTCLGGQGALVHRRDHASGRLRLVASSGLAQDSVEAWADLPDLADVVPARAVQRGALVWVGRDRLESGASGAVAVPLPGANGPIGALTVLTAGSGEPDDVQRSFLYAIAAWLACLESLPSAAADVAESERSIRMGELTAALAEALSSEDVVRAVAEHVLPPFGADGLGIHAFEGDRLETVGLVGHPPGYRGYWSRLQGFPLTSHPIISDVFHTRTPLFIETKAELLRRYPEMVRLTAASPKNSWAFLPLIAAGRAIGCCIVSFAHSRSFSEQERTLLTALSGLVAQSLERARLYDAEHARAQEQAALRHVATIVACSPVSTEMFSAVAAEMGRIVGADSTAIERREPDGTVTVVGSWNKSGAPQLFTPGSRLPVEDGSVLAQVLQTGQPSHASSNKDVPREGEVVGSAVVVEGRLWGAVIAFSAGPEPLPEGTEERMFDFIELAATGIAKAESRAQLVASRARVVAAADASRRRIERDLHDGAQQRLVSLGLELRAAEAELPSELIQIKEQLSHITSGLVSVLDELRELSRGLHPAILSKGGLAPAIMALGRRSAIPVELHLHVDRSLPDQVEVAAYYIVSEALTNAAKHSHASLVTVRADAEETVLRIAVRDDGNGGADPRQGSGLTGLVDRVEAIGGTLCIDSPVGRGTSLLAAIPIITR